MEINITASAFNYRLFYILAFVLSHVILLFILKVKNKLNGQYLLTIAMSTLAFVIGCKVFPFLEIYFNPPVGDNLIHLGQSTIGGVLLGTATLLIMVRFMKLDYRFFDYYAIAVIISFAFQKVGCLYGGCCYGSGDGLISVIYDDGIAHTALPIYQMIGYLSTLLPLVFLSLSKKEFSKGSFGFMALAGYALIQFSLGFYKAQETSIVLGEDVLGIAVIQWVYLLVFLLALYFFINSILNRPSMKEDSLSEGKALFRMTIVFTSALAVLILTHDYLYQIEIYAVLISLTPAIVLIMIRCFKLFTHPQYRLASILLVLLPLFLMSQTVLKEDSIFRYSYHSLGLGLKSGNAQNRIVFDTTPDSCDGNSTARNFDHTFSLVGIGYSYSIVEKQGKKNNKVEVGLNTIIGKHTEIPFDDLTAINEVNIFDINPFVYLDSRWIGAKFGAHIGNSSRFLTKKVYETTGPILTGSKQSVFIPQLSVRLGPIKYLFFEYNYASQFLSPLPEMPKNFAFGSGFGLDNGFYLKIGFTGSTEQSVYFSSYIPIKDRFVIEPLFRINTENRYYQNQGSNTVMIGGHYRFGRSVQPKKPKNY